VCGAPTDGDQMTKILKLYGDDLEKLGATAAEVPKQRCILRGIILLIRLMGKYIGRFLPQASPICSLLVCLPSACLSCHISPPPPLPWPTP
jgi:hypothetical protein